MPKPNVPQPTVDEAKAALASLREKHAHLMSRQSEITRERERFAGKSLIDGNARATRQLENLRTESISITVSMADLEAAIAEGEARLKAATERQAQAQEVQDAERAREIMAARVAAAQRAEAALAEYARCMEELVLAGRDLRRLTDKAPSSAWESLAWEAATANCRFGFFQKGILPSSPPARSEMRHPLPILIGRIDQLVAKWSDGLLGAEEPQTQQEAA